MEGTNNEGKPSEMLFIHLVTMFQVAAMQQMGKVVNPITQKIERDLEQARFSIDMLNMIREKTEGNLSNEEQEYLSKVLFELHMNYVDESKRVEKEVKEAEKEEEVAQPGGEGKVGKEPRREEAAKQGDRAKKASKTGAKAKKRAPKKRKTTPKQPS